MVIGLVAFSCKKDKPNPTATILPKDSTGRVLIVCEGSLGNGNSELSIYYPNKDSVFNDVYKNANGQSLGDVFQSVSKINQQYFLCVNNSDKIVVLDANTWQQKATIKASKPRYLLDVGHNRAYVGSLFSNTIFVINTLTFSVEKEIKMPYQNAEGMILKDGIAYVCCWDTACNKLYQINTSTDNIIDSIQLAGNAPQNILLDKENKIWVMAGNAYKAKDASLSRIDISTKKTIQSFLFSKGIEAIKANYNGGTVNNGVFRMPIGSSSLPDKALIACQANQYFWGLAVEPNSGNIYVGDPKGFVQKGTVLIYNPSAQLLQQFNVGLGVGSFLFD
jgi:DNA-binding beta-propeller fold protein YncE